MNNINTLLNEIKISLSNEEKDILYINNSTPSIKRDYVLKTFNDIYNLTNNKIFKLEKISKILYKNNYFELKNDNLKFIGIRSDFIINEIDSISNFKEFTPRCSKDFALIHDTHNNSELNQSETTILLLRTSLIEFNENTLKTFILNKYDNRLYNNKNKNLIIIENYKIFELNNLKEYFENFDIEIKDYIEYNVIYGAGNKINSFKNINLLNSFEEILYFGDYDNEGYDIYKNLKNKLSINISYILPKKEIILEIQNLMNQENISLKRKKDKDYLIKNDLLELFGLNKMYEMQQEVFNLNYQMKN